MVPYGFPIDFYRYDIPIDKCLTKPHPNYTWGPTSSEGPGAAEA